MNKKQLKNLIMEIVKETISENILPVVIKERKKEYWECPHCHQEIYEKHMYVENGIDHHSDCGKPIQLPKLNWNEVAEWLKPHLDRSKFNEGVDSNWTNWVNSMVNTIDESLQELQETSMDEGEAYDIIKTNFRADSPSRDMFDKACKEALQILRKTGRIH